MLNETIRAAGSDVGLRTGLARWRRPGAEHDPANVVLVLAATLALGGDCLADVAVLRTALVVCEAVVSDPTVSSAMTALAAGAPAELAALKTDRAAARAQVRERTAGHAAPRKPSPPSEPDRGTSYAPSHVGRRPPPSAKTCLKPNP